MPKQNVTSFSFKLLNLVFLLHARLKSPFLSCQATLLLLLEGCTKSPFFSRMNNHNSLRLSSEKRCSSPLINFVALLWTILKDLKSDTPDYRKSWAIFPRITFTTSMIWQGFMLEPSFCTESPSNVVSKSTVIKSWWAWPQGQNFPIYMARDGKVIKLNIWMLYLMIWSF